MTFLSDRPRHPHLAICLSLFLSLGSGLARAADELPATANTFSTPSYPAATPRTGGTGAPTTTTPAQGALPTDPAAQRGLQNGASSRPGTAATTTPFTDPGVRRADLPPPKPSEFQRFVEAATGRMLPLFGAGFFTDPSTSFAPVDNVPVSADYTVGPGDEIMLRAWGSIDVDYRATVDRNGLLNLPKVGSFNVAGVKAADLEKNLRSQMSRLFTNFDLSVSLGQLRGLKVFVVGPAQRPGVYTLASQSTLLSAVVMAGGPAPTGSMRKVLLRRDGRVVSELDIYEFLVQGDKSKDVQLAAGDVIVFQAAGARVALNGALDLPAIYELKGPQEPLREVLRYGGGTPALANPNRALLERIDVAQAGAARFVEEFKLDGNGLQKPLRDGDVVTLLAISPQFGNAVTLKGHVAQPLRYAYKPGMRIRDLIPDPEALISPDFYRRKNLLVQVLEDDDDFTAGADQTGAATGVATGATADSGRNAADSGRIAADPSRAARTPAERRRMRDDRAAADLAKKSPSSLFDDLNWDYAVVERLNKQDLSTQLIPFNLGKAVLQGDPTQNIELMAGDVVTVYSQKDIRVPVARQTRLVSIEGEVSSPGVYQLLPGETLKGLIERTGGITPQAYLFGLDFSREETRRRQRENLVTAIARLESLSATQAAKDSANRRDDAAGAASSAAVSAAATQAQMTRLRSVQPNGRVALELDPGITLASALPDVPLEAGDRIVVPPRPGFVTVAGAVVNTNAYLWRPGRTAGDYLRLAGPDESAEIANMFILRADGTVASASTTRGFFGRETLESQVMHPGDALFIPNQLDFETWGRVVMRNLKDIAVILSGFGIAIAAIHSL
jgi:protein involved in polysaccharide export with SLBB domain